MRVADILKLSLINLSCSRTRTLLTAFSVMIGIMSTLLVTAIGQGIGGAVQDEFDSTGLSGISLYPKKAVADGGVMISDEDAVAVMAGVDGIDTAMPMILKYSSYKMKNWQGNIVLYGIDENLSDIFTLELKYGRLPGKADVSRSTPCAVIDTDFAEMVYGRENIVGKTIEIYIGSGYHELEIIGIVSSASSQLSYLTGVLIPKFVYIPYTAYQVMSGDSSVDQIFINVSDNSTAEVAAGYLDRRYGIKDGFTYNNLSSFRDGLGSAMNYITLFIGVTAVISVIVAGFGIMNMMFSSTVERRREIGVYMALGARRRDIVLSFLSEAVLISLAGGLAGIVAALAALRLASALVGISFLPGFGTIFLVLLFSAGCGAVFGFIPAYRAASLEPTQTLRD